MFSKKNNKDKEMDIQGLNQIISLTHKILKIFYVFVIIIGIYIVIKVFKELNVKNTIFVILKTISPLFIGLFIAWLFDPFVKWLKKKGIKRIFGAIITYVLLIGAILLISGSIIPLLYEQVNDFAKMLPNVFESIKIWINEIFNNLDKVESIDAIAIKENLFNKVEVFGLNLASSLPDIMIKIIKSILSGGGNLVIGLIIGFYLLVSFDNANDMMITLLPKKMQNDARDLVNEVNTSLRHFIQGILIDATLVFIVTSIGFWICGLKAPLLFGLFCGITNIIPYAGPYIGGIPAAIVGFSQSPIIGIITVIIIVVVQFLEGNLLQPFVMSKTTKLHPVTIIIGLLVFSYFFGIFGMVISTPIIAAVKAIFMYFNEKYELINI